MLKKFVSLIVVILVVATSAAVVAQRGAVEIRSTHVAGTVHMLIGQGGNIGVCSGPDGLLMIDDQFEPLAPKIQVALDSLGKGKLKYILNTHHHGDHTGGNTVFGRQAPIVAHTNVRKRLADGGKPAHALPQLTYDQGMTIHFNGEEIQIIHLPAGHTDGDSIVHFKKSNVVHMGDHFFNGRFPFVDLSSGGAIDGYLANVDKVLKMIKDDTKVIPGHGDLATKADLQHFHESISETVAMVRKMKSDGKSLEAAQQVGLPDKWDGWGSGFISTDRWIETIYNGTK